MEKLSAIHSLARQLAANALAEDKLRRHGRHFYDVYLLLGDPRVLDLLTDRAQTEQIMASVEEISRQNFGAAGEPGPEGGFAASPAFDRNSDVSLRMRGAYQTIMPELYFGTEPLPTWDEICTRVRERHQLLRLT